MWSFLISISIVITCTCEHDSYVPVSFRVGRPFQVKPTTTRTRKPSVNKIEIEIKQKKRRKKTFPYLISVCCRHRSTPSAVPLCSFLVVSRVDAMHWTADPETWMEYAVRSFMPHHLHSPIWSSFIIDFFYRLLSSVSPHSPHPHISDTNRRLYISIELHCCMSMTHVTHTRYTLRQC